MSRSTQVIGPGPNNPINEEELQWLEAVEYERHGMFDDHPLFVYRFGDQIIYQEVVHWSPWSSGPMLHTAYLLVKGLTPIDPAERCKLYDITELYHIGDKLRLLVLYGLSMHQAEDLIKKQFFSYWKENEVEA